MSLNLQNRYPGHFDPVSSEYPQGKFKNRSSPDAEDGSYMERDWLNDWSGFFGALLSGAGKVPDGSVDTALSSQLFTALLDVILKPLPKRSFTSNDYIRIPDVPGGLIVQWGIVTSPVNGTATASFPVPFPKSALQGVCTYDNPVSGFYPTVAIAFPSASTCTIGVKSTQGTTFAIRYLVFGY